VDHINLKTDDNRVENLRYATNSEQTRSSYANNPTRKKGSEVTSKPVQCRRNETDAWSLPIKSAAEAKKQMKISEKSISAVCNGKRRTAGGFYWKFVPPEVDTNGKSMETDADYCANGSNVEESNADTFSIETPEPAEIWKVFSPEEHSFFQRVSKPKKSTKPRGTVKISNFGRVKTVYDVITTGSTNSSGYKKCFCNGDKYLVHDIVARVFIGPPPSSSYSVNHLDLDRTNNNVSNLEWTTMSEQAKHSYRNNPNRKSIAATRSKPVLGRRIGSTEWILYESVNSAARILDVNGSGVSHCCLKKKKRTGDYEFQYAPDERSIDLPGEIWRTIKVKFW
jgi:hypothetical protein